MDMRQETEGNVMKLEPIEEIAPDVWDEAIARFDSRHLFHQSAWLNFLQETQKGRIVRFRIVNDGKEEGYFAGLIVRKGPFRILGSPLRGWMTDYMGPIVNRGFDTEKFADALDALCRKRHIHHVQICNPFLEQEVMSKKGFTVSEATTYLVPLSRDEDGMWQQLDRKSCRQSINKAKREGLIVEEVDERDTASFIDEFYSELREVFARQGLVPTYDIERVRSFYRNLRRDQILSLQVRHGDHVIATAIFPHDDRCVYGFGFASRKRFQVLRPNDLLIWTIMTHAARRGIQLLDLTGKGSFKPKFGSEKVAVHNYMKSYSLLAKFGREAYRSFFYAKQKIKGGYAHLLSNRHAPVSEDD